MAAAEPALSFGMPMDDADGTADDPSGIAAASACAHPPGPDIAEYRLRFYNFNLANSSTFGSIADLQGPGGRGLFETIINEPFADGRAVDLAFMTFVETRLALSDYVQALDRQKRTRVVPKAQLDVVVTQNAMKEVAKSKNDWGFRGLMEGLAATYNGNLKTMLAYSSRKFMEDEGAQVYGRLPESKVAGITVPNPKKAFTGRSVCASESPEGLRLCLAGAHFPIDNLAAKLEAMKDPVQGTKVALARTLRKVLRRASRRGLLDERTILLIQGDINSRTVLTPGGEHASLAVADTLLELLQDEPLQAAIQEGLSVPPGCWREVVHYEAATALPVTYKFSEEVGRTFAKVRVHDRDCESCANGKAHEAMINVNDWGCPVFLLEDVLQAAQASVSVARTASSSPRPGEPVETYRRTLASVPQEKLDGWGLQFKESGFRPFRFPACADRVIYWAPLDLAARTSWVLPQGGYEVNHYQGGSDHRPVSLEAILRVEPLAEEGAKDDEDRRSSYRKAAAAVPASVLREVCQSDGEESDGGDGT